nr:hypothetical protein [Tanacetum cinerariifolium]
MAVDLLMHTNFHRAFTASTIVPCQLDEQWFVLTKDTLREALQITPINNTQAFVSPPSVKVLVDLVNQLGYHRMVRNVSNIVTNDMFQPWRALTTIINLCPTGKTSGFERPRAPVLQILWGIVTQSNIDYAERIWEEFTQSIHTFMEDKRNLSWHTTGKKRATLILIPSIRFTKLIIHHLQRRLKFHQRPDSTLHMANDEPVIGYLNANGTKRKVFGMPIPGRLITTNIQEASYYQEYQENVAKHRGYLAGEKGSTQDLPALKPAKPARKPKEPESGKYQPSPEVPGKGKAKVTEEHVAHDLLNNEEESKKVLTGASEGGNDDVQTGPDPDIQNEGQKETDADTLDEGQAGSNPDERSEITGNEEQSIPNPVVHAGSDHKHMDLDVTKASPQPSTKQLDEGFLATAYPKIQESLKLAVEEHVLLEEPASSSGTLSSLHHLSKDISFGDQFLSDKPLDVDKNAETKVESMVNVPIQQPTSSISISPMISPIIHLSSRPVSPKVHQQFKATTTDTTTTTTTTVPPPQAQQQSTAEAMMGSVSGASVYTRTIGHPSTGEHSCKRSGHGCVTPPPPPPPPPSTSQDSPSKGSAAPSPSKTSASTELQAWTTPDVTLRPFISLTPADLDMDEAMGPDEQAQLLDDEDIGSAYIPTMKAAYYPDVGLEQMVPDQFWINEECKYDIVAMYGISHWWAVIFQDKYRVQMMMRLNEIHKFSDGTMHQIDETLDYRVKEFRINMMNPGLNTRFWTRKDVDRCKAFMFAIQRRLRLRRIFRNLESFVGGRLIEGDYRLLKRTE